MLHRVSGKNKREFILAVIISTVIYLTFFYPILNPKIGIYSGSDTQRRYYPSRYYIYEKLHNYEFPFWTERIFLGHPFYQNLERGALNPINLATIFLLGPINSYKLMHFFYIFGRFTWTILLFKEEACRSSWIYCCKSNILFFFLSHLSSTTHKRNYDNLPLSFGSIFT